MQLLVILGPTASGKTQIAVQASRRLGGEIISADSRQVYRGLDIGSGKDLAEYGEIRHHLIDIADPGREYSLFDFVRDFSGAYETITSRQRLPVLAGGTGLYLDAVLRGYRLVPVAKNEPLRRELAALNLGQLQQRLMALRPDLHNTTDLHDRERLVRAIEIAEGEQRADAEELPLPPLAPRVYGLRWPRAVLRERITQRLRERLEQGMIDEVANLRAAGVPWETLEYYGLEYRYIAWHLQGRLNHNDLFLQLNSAIHQFAKRQETWFRRMERQGVDICWLDGAGDPLAALLADWAEHAP